MKTATFRIPYLGLTGALLFTGASAASAQTNGTLTGTAATYTYSTAPWVITSGPGTYPDGGGVATFNPITGATPGTLLASSTVTLDVSPTLSQVAINTPIQYILAAAAGQSLVAANTGLTLNTIATAQNVTVGGVGISIAFGSQITAPISGGGTFGLTRTGSGNLALSGANTYTGGTHFNGGFTTISGTAAVGDSIFGTTGAGNGLSFNGGSVLFNTTSGLTTGRDIFIDTGGANLVTNTSTTVNGIVSGSGSLALSALSASTLTLTGANTFTGATTIRGATTQSSSPAVALTLSGTGSLASSSSYDLMGTFTLDNSGTNVTNRLSDTAAVTIRGGNFVSTGNGTATSSETIGAVTLNNGNSAFLVTPGATAANSLTMASLTRANNATAVFRGTGLGGTPGNTVSNIYITAPPTLVGGGGGPGSTGISIIPYAIGNTSNSVLFTAAGQVGSSLVTYDVNGVRPLATTEYATAFGVNATDNVRITAATAAPAATANAVLFAPAAAATLSGGPINVTSGTFLYSPTAAATGTVSAALNFGTAEGVIFNTSPLVVSGILSGSGGLTLAATSPSTAEYTPNLTLSGANTYTGNTTINSGVVGYSGTVAAATNGAFGTSGNVILNGGTALASLSSTASATFSRNISVVGSGLNYIAAAASGFTSTYSGSINIATNLNVEGFSNAAASGFIFSGPISGTGSLTDVGFTYATISGNNTYSGGTFLSGASGSTFLLGSDTAFGTGTIYVNAATASLQGVGTTARTLANPLFLNNTMLTGGAAPLTFTGAVNLNGSRTMTISSTAGTTFTGALSSGSLTKGGTGAVAFNSPTGSTFTGGFLNTGVAATASAIYVNNTTGSGLGTGAVSVGAASATVFSTLAGNFTLAGATSIAGRLSPGNGTGLTPATAGQGSIGLVGFAGPLTLSSATTSSLFLEVASSTSYDRIVVAGASLFTLNGTVNLATTNGYTAQLGDSYDFLDFGLITVGTFTINSTGLALAPGTMLDTSRFVTDGIVTVTAVPEPTTFALFGAGAVALAGYAMHRRRALAV